MKAWYCGAVPALWLSLYTAGGAPVPVGLLVEITHDALVESGVPPVVDARGLTAVLAAMELAGAVELTADLARLTPLGLRGVRDALRAEGFDAPLIEGVSVTRLRRRPDGRLMLAQTGPG